MAFQSLVLVNATTFNGNADKHGEAPILLNVLAGKAPNRNIISGTVAIKNGFEIGKMYIVQITEGKESPQYGRQFNHNKISEVKVTEMVDIMKGFGAAIIFDVTGTSAETPAISTDAKSVEQPALIISDVF